MQKKKTGKNKKNITGNSDEIPESSKHDIFIKKPVVDYTQV
jgi:hypothetical protein